MREVTLTSIDEPVVVLLERLVRVATAAKLNSSNTKRTAVLGVLELALVSRSNSRLEQFLEIKKRKRGGKTRGSAPKN